MKSKAISTASMMLMKITVCLQGFQDTVAPPNMNTNPMLDFILSESVTQLASLYHSMISEYPVSFKQ